MCSNFYFNDNVFVIRNIKYREWAGFMQMDQSMHFVENQYCVW